MNKRAMGIGQVFIFIVAAITFALIMIFGYKAITGFIQSGEEVSFIQFKSDLETSVKKIYTEFGAVRVEQFTLPLTYTQICFVDMDYLDMPPELRQKDPTAYDAYRTAQQDSQTTGKTAYNSANQNVFLQPPTTVPIKVHTIEIYNEDDTERLGFLCQDIEQGRFRIVFEGRGDKTRLTKATVEYQ